MKLQNKSVTLGSDKGVALSVCQNDRLPQRLGSRAFDD